MRLFRNSFSPVVFSLSLLLSVQAVVEAAPPQGTDDRVFITFRSTPDGARAAFEVTQGGFFRRLKRLAGDALSAVVSTVTGGAFGGDSDTPTVEVNRTLTVRFSNDLKISSTFELDGYDPCKVTATLKSDGGRRWIVIDKEKKSLSFNNSGNPAEIPCAMRRKGI